MIVSIYYLPILHYNLTSVLASQLDQPVARRSGLVFTVHFIIDDNNEVEDCKIFNC